MRNSARPRPRGRLGLGVALCAAGIALAIPSSASAVSVVTVAEGLFDISAAPGIANQMTVTTTPDSITVTDTADTLTSGGNPACTGDDTNTVVCAVPAALVSWTANGSDLDDRLEAIGPLQGTLSGSDGVDELVGGISTSTLDGGPGEDRLVGGPGSEQLLGGPDKDAIFGNDGNDLTRIPPTDGDDVVSLGAGDDELMGTSSGMVVDLGPGNDNYGFNFNFPEAFVSVDGGAGSDTIAGLSFGAPFVSASIDLAGGTMIAALPGAATRTVKGFENIAGTLAGGDTIVGTSDPNVITGGPSPAARFISSLLFGSALPSLPDTVDPGTGPDVVKTGGSDDHVTVADGYLDRVFCGSGADAVTADQFDVLEDCELVTLQRSPAAVADTQPPVCKLTRAAKRSSRKAFLRGYPVSFACDEAVAVIGTIVVSPKARKGKVVLSKAGDLTLAEQTTQAGAGSIATLTLKPGPRKLARKLPARFGARVVIDARDEFGNHTTLTQHVRVTGPKAKRKPTGRKRR